MLECEARTPQRTGQRSSFSKPGYFPGCPGFFCVRIAVRRHSFLTSKRPMIPITTRSTLHIALTVSASMGTPPKVGAAQAAKRPRPRLYRIGRPQRSMPPSPPPAEDSAAFDDPSHLVLEAAWVVHVLSRLTRDILRPFVYCVWNLAHPPYQADRLPKGGDRLKEGHVFCKEAKPLCAGRKTVAHVHLAARIAEGSEFA